MFFGTEKDAINSVFCDFSAGFEPGQIFEDHGFKWPDDFENAESVGQAKFQVINDLKSGLCIYNHEGTLHPFTEKKILERQYKVKKNVIVERFGNLNPFRADNVYFLETGFNLGNVEYMTFDYKKDNRSSYSSFRKTIHSFPLFWLMMTVLALKEQSNKKSFSLESLEKLENDKILKHAELNGWQFMSRDTSPSADEYRERVELPLRNYYFQRNDQVHIWLKFEFFEA